MDTRAFRLAIAVQLPCTAMSPASLIAKLGLFYGLKYDLGLKYGEVLCVKKTLR